MEDARRRTSYWALIATIIALALFLLLLAYSFGKLRIAKNAREGNGADVDGKIIAVAAVEPIADLIQRVGGEYVDAKAITPPGKSPEEFAPSPALLRDLAGAKVVFWSGLPIEDRLQKNVHEIAPRAFFIDLRENVEPLPNPHEPHEQHDGEEDPAGLLNSEVDPHLWTSPEVARSIVYKIDLALENADPEHAAEYRKNAEALDAELEALQKETAEALEPYKGRFFLVAHPAYGYYAREFGLEQRAIESGGKAPKARELEELIARAREEGVAGIVVQPEFSREAGRAVAEQTGAKILTHSPLERDYFENIRSLTNAVLESFSKEAASE